MTGELAGQSREVVLRVTLDGDVVELDERARRAFALEPGQPFASIADHGSEQKARELVRRAQEKPVSEWELMVRGRDRSVPYVFDAVREGDAIALLGTRVPDAYARALAALSASASELALLHRQSETQQRDLARRNADLVRLNGELSDASRGVKALHAELDEKADTLHRATEVKARLVANVSHEFRTPINSILSMTGLLLDRVDGPLTAEQEKQLGFVRQAAEALSIMTTDMLDLSKAEIGKLTVRSSLFKVDDLFAALRGMLRPLVPSTSVQLVFDDPPAIGALETDEPKIAQVLRNLIGNALKFTAEGEVRVRAEADGDFVRFVVSDTGIGIAERDQQRIFDEFTQVESAQRPSVKGSGLGLALGRKLAALLGGTLGVESELGRGSTFTLRVPRVHPEVTAFHEIETRASQPDPKRAPVLVVEDDRQTLFLYERYLSGAGFQVLPVRTIDDARARIAERRPAAIVLDVMLEGETTWQFLTELKANPETRDIPALVVTVTDREQKARALGADEFFVKPVDREWLVKKLGKLARADGQTNKVLVIDDDEIAAYVIKKHLADMPYRVIEARTGKDGVSLARLERPRVIFLDFALAETTAFEVLDELKRDPITRSIPVVLSTSRDLAPEDRARLARDTAAILSKQSLSREVALARVREALESAVAAESEPG